MLRPLLLGTPQEGFGLTEAAIIHIMIIISAPREWSSMITINVSQAKKDFLELIRRIQEKEKVVVQKKGEPVAAILPYDEYLLLDRFRQYFRIQELGTLLQTEGLSAGELYKLSRSELEGRQED